MVHKVELLNMVAEPLVSALGGEYSPGSVEGEAQPKRRRRGNPNSHRNADYKTPEAKEAAMNAALSRLPIRVRTRNTSGDGPSADG